MFLKENDLDFSVQNSLMTFRAWHVSKLNPNLLRSEYAVRGEVAIRAEQLNKWLGETTKLPFTKIVNCNIGNPQQLQQKPITFFRQVASLVEYPALMDPENEQHIASLYPKDAIKRAREMLKACGWAIGAYSHSQGITKVREHVAEFITRRDGGVPARPDHIFLTNGASQGVQFILQSLIEHSNVGVMIPIPQYPLYTASLSLYNGKAVPYYLQEEKCWSLDIDELKRSIQEAKKEGIDTRALCVINPGNPTGNCLTEENIREILQFCFDESLVLLADEVYQVNTYHSEKPFHSFKKVLKNMKPELANHLGLISFHSISKGVLGECGRRGGYFECTNIAPGIMEQFYKLASISLCPNVQGQLMVDLMVRPPQEGDESYDLYQKETTEIYESMKRRAKKLVAAFNQMEGVSCQEAEGAMYTFPQITLPPKAIEEAKRQGKEPDAYYVLQLLDNTGVCMVPGSGFGQKEGTYHFRSTFLPPEELFDDFINRIQLFHKDFMRRYK